MEKRLSIDAGREPTTTLATTSCALAEVWRPIRTKSIGSLWQYTHPAFPFPFIYSLHTARQRSSPLCSLGAIGASLPKPSLVFADVIAAAAPRQLTPIPTPIPTIYAVRRVKGFRPSPASLHRLASTASLAVSDDQTPPLPSPPHFSSPKSACSSGAGGAVPTVSPPHPSGESSKQKQSSTENVHRTSHTAHHPLRRVGRLLTAHSAIGWAQARRYKSTVRI